MLALRWGCFFKSITALTNRVNCVSVFNMPFYAVAKGRSPGIFMTWPDCESQVKGFPGARYKKFDTVNAAQDFIVANGGSVPATKNTDNYNLKRSLPVKKRDSIPVKQRKSYKQRNDIYDSDADSSISDEDYISDVLNQQMDSIEKRIKAVAKNVNKISKKGEVKQAIMINPQSKSKKRPSVKDIHGFDFDDNGFVEVYTDGACSSNGTTNARAGLGVYWGESHPLNISEPVSGRATNNCGEIQAATRAIKQALENGIPQLKINTDSKFLINSVTKWIPGWKRKGWKLKTGEPVKNEIDFKELDEVQDKLIIRWNYVEAHKGIHGNEMADQLAKAGAAMYRA